jgi:hypothetical protein
VFAWAAWAAASCRTFTIGQAAGASGTVKLRNFTEHIRDVMDMPNSSVPIPYVDLLWAALPRNSDNKKKAKEDPKTCGTLSAYGAEGASSVASSAVDFTDMEDAANVDSVRSGNFYMSCSSNRSEVTRLGASHIGPAFMVRADVPYAQHHLFAKF